MTQIKYYLFLTLIAITSSASYAQKAYLLNRPLNGKVKSATFKLSRLQNDDQSIRIIEQQELLIGQYGFDLLHRFEFDLKGNLIYEKGPERFYHRKYNTAGQLIESLNHTNAIANKRIMGKQTFNYLNGKLMASRDYSYITGKECLLQSVTHTFDKSGNLTQITTSFFNCDSQKTPSSVQQSHRKYDARHLLIEENHYNTKGVLSTTVKYTYDINKRITSKATISHQDTYGATEHYLYDDNGNITEHTSVDKLGNQKSKELKVYDAQNNILELTSHDSNSGKTKRIIYNYNLTGQLIKEKRIVDNQLSFSVNYDLDKAKNVVTATFYNAQDVPVVKYAITYVYFP